ncbi:Phosphoribosylformylglycinamidine synthase subunit PurQ, partial [Frankliniella fusca]
MNDSDLQEMGIKKGARMDILRTIKTASESNKITAVSTNSKAHQATRVVMSQTPVAMQNATPSGSGNIRQSPFYSPSSPTFSSPAHSHNGSPSMFQSSFFERDGVDNLEHQQHQQLNNESLRQIRFGCFGNETNNMEMLENEDNRRSIFNHGSRTEKLTASSEVIPSPSTRNHPSMFPPSRSLSIQPDGSSCSLFGKFTHPSGSLNNQAVGQSSSGLFGKLTHPSGSLNNQAVGQSSSGLFGKLTHPSGSLNNQAIGQSSSGLRQDE